MIMPGQPSILDLIKQDLEIKKCREDPVYFISNYLKIVEPRNINEGIELMPFKLWDFQIDYVQLLERHLKTKKGATVKKCRDQGITLCTMAWIFWHWRFTPHFSALVGSLREEEVKKTEGEADPLLSKVDLFLKNLPDWLMPKGFDYDKHSQTMVLINPEQNSSIVGSTMNENFGISKRKTVIFIDEDAQLKKDVGGQCQQASNTVIRVSTVNGNNHFEDACNRAKANGELVEVPYHVNPTHDEAWLEDQGKKLTKLEFGRFILMDFNASQQGPVYEDFWSVPISEEYDYTPDRLLCTAWDFGLSDETVILFIQYDPSTRDVFVIDEVVEAGIQNVIYFVPFVPGSMPVAVNPYSYTPEQEQQIDRHRFWKRPVRNFGDKSGDANVQGQIETPWRTLDNHRIKIQLNDKFYYNMPMRNKIVRQALPRVRVHPRCKRFIKSMRNYHYPKVSGTASHKDPTPEHDENSHACTALEFFFISENLIPRVSEEDTENRNRVVRKNKWEFAKWA